MIKVKTLIVGSLSTNCYLIFDEKTREAIIIDPGDDADYIERVISDLALIPIKIIVTHGHFDHALAIFELKSAYKIPFCASKKDEFLLKNISKSAQFFSKIKNSFIPKIDINIKNNDEIILGKEKLKVIETPGHTPGSLSFYFPESKIAFVGDIFFADGTLGRCDFKYGDKKELIASVAKILKLGKRMKVYSGHGPASKT